MSEVARTYYEVLGVKPSAKHGEIKKAFVEISKEVIRNPTYH